MLVVFTFYVYVLYPLLLEVCPQQSLFSHEALLYWEESHALYFHGDSETSPTGSFGGMALTRVITETCLYASAAPSLWPS